MAHFEIEPKDEGEQYERGNTEDDEAEQEGIGEEGLHECIIVFFGGKVKKCGVGDSFVWEDGFVIKYRHEKI